MWFVLVPSSWQNVAREIPMNEWDYAEQLLSPDDTGYDVVYFGF